MPPPAPNRRDDVIRFDVPESACLCRLTGQPDLAHVKFGPRFLRQRAHGHGRGAIRSCGTAEHRRKGGKPLPRVDLGSSP